MENSLSTRYETVWVHRVDGWWMATPGHGEDPKMQPAKHHFAPFMTERMRETIFFESQTEIDAFLAADLSRVWAGKEQALAALQNYVRDVRRPKHQILVLTFQEAVDQFSFSKFFDPADSNGNITFQSLIAAQFEPLGTVRRPPLFTETNLMRSCTLGHYLDDEESVNFVVRYRMLEALTLLSNNRDLRSTEAMIAAGARKITAKWKWDGIYPEYGAKATEKAALIVEVEHPDHEPFDADATTAGWYRCMKHLSRDFYGEIWILEIPEIINFESVEWNEPNVASSSRSLPMDVILATAP